MHIVWEFLKMIGYSDMVGIKRSPVKCLIKSRWVFLQEWLCIIEIHQNICSTGLCICMKLNLKCWCTISVIQGPKGHLSSISRDFFWYQPYHCIQSSKICILPIRAKHKEGPESCELFDTSEFKVCEGDKAKRSPE